MRKSMLCLTIWLNTSCAVLHHAQLGDIDDRQRGKRFFDIKVNEIGVDVGEAGMVMATISRRREARDAMDVIGLFQMGPRTGNPVFDPDYATPLLKNVYRECPSGKVTGLLSVRETAKYPGISGEILKVTGWCLN